MLSRIIHSASCMGDLIQDMLDFSRASGAELQFHSLDMSAIAQQVVDDLREQDMGHVVEVHIDPGMEAQAVDAAMMRVVLNNLIGNAWKYSAKAEHPKISVRAGEDKDCRFFYVRDNGVGFDMDFADKLFKPFSRLHNEDEFEGNGIGSATVERIIRNHGGKVWVEAAIDQGACFCFTAHEGVRYD